MNEINSDVISRLKEALEYFPSTGKFLWKVRRGKMRAGMEAGSVNNFGYATIRFDGKDYTAHRLAWIFTHGSPARMWIDHINGIKTDNRITNLRLVTPEENQYNRHRTKSESGHIGVFSSRKRWRARIHKNGARIDLGSFDTIEEATAAYLSAKESLHIIERRSL